MLLLQNEMAFEYFKYAELLRQARNSDIPGHFCTDSALPGYQCR